MKQRQITGVFVYGLHRSGTMFMQDFFRRACELTGSEFYSSNNEPKNHDALSADTERSFCLCPVRRFRLDPRRFPHADEIHHLIQLRDPRDILVSQYYSFGWSHPDNSWTEERKLDRQYIQTLSLDEYALKFCTAKQPYSGRPSLKARYANIIPILANRQPGTHTLKYEDMVEHTERWLRVALAPFALDPDREPAATLAEWAVAQFQVTREHRDRHKRKVIPGDHREKLKPSTVEALNRTFAPELKALDYSV